MVKEDKLSKIYIFEKQEGGYDKLEEIIYRRIDEDSRE